MRVSLLDYMSTFSVLGVPRCDSLVDVGVLPQNVRPTKVRITPPASRYFYASRSAWHLLHKRVNGGDEWGSLPAASRLSAGLRMRPSC